MRFPTDSHYVVRVRWGTHSLIRITETNTSIVNQLFLNSLAQNTAWNRISKYKIRSLHVVSQLMVYYQLSYKPAYKRRILLRLYHENIDKRIQHARTIIHNNTLSNGLRPNRQKAMRLSSKRILTHNNEQIRKKLVTNTANMHIYTNIVSLSSII